MTTEKVYVSAVEHKHGTNFYVNRTEAGALDALYNFVGEWWDYEELAGQPDENGDAIGEIGQYDKSTAIEIYFTYSDDESWTMGETVIGP